MATCNGSGCIHSHTCPASHPSDYSPAPDATDRLASSQVEGIVGTKPMQSFLPSERASGTLKERATCVFFLKNRCSHGQKCRFSHAVQAHISPCKFFRQGLCRNGDSCFFFHDTIAIDPHPPPNDSASPDDDHERASEAPSEPVLPPSGWDDSPSIVEPEIVAVTTSSIAPAPTSPLQGTPLLEESSSKFHMSSTGVTAFEPCMFHTTGQCMRGDSCVVEHGQPAEQYSPIPSRASPLIADLESDGGWVQFSAAAIAQVASYSPQSAYLSQGMCNMGFVHGHEPFFTPEMPKTPQYCKYFALGTCRKANDCPLVHDIRAQPAPERNIDNSRKPCLYFNEGRCRRGNNCRFYHDSNGRPPSPRPNPEPSDEQDSGWLSNADGWGAASGWPTSEPLAENSSPSHQFKDPDDSSWAVDAPGSEPQQDSSSGPTHVISDPETVGEQETNWLANTDDPSKWLADTDDPSKWLAQDPGSQLQEDSSYNDGIESGTALDWFQEVEESRVLQGLAEPRTVLSSTTSATSIASPPANRTNDHSPKVGFCKFHNQGHCRKENNCRFRHDPENGWSPSARAPPTGPESGGEQPTNWLADTHPDSWAPDSQDVTTEWGVRDPVSQPQRPNSYRRVDNTPRSGWMQEIDDKEWVMDQQAEQGTVNVQGPNSSALAFGYSSQERAPCVFFLKNRCLHGDSCRFSHNVSDSDIKPTLSPCIYFRRGSCRDGDSCSFFHGALDPSSSFSGGGDHPAPAATGWETEHPEHSELGWLNHTDESPEWNEWNATQRADEWITNVEANGPGNALRSSPVPESLRRPPDPLSDAILSPEPEPEPQSLYRCTVRFGSGAIPEEVATEFDAFRLTLSNYPLGIAHEDLVQLVAPWGVVKNTTFSVTHGGMRAHIEFEECSQAAEARVNLNGITLDELVMHAQLDSIGSVSGNIHEPKTGCQLKLVWEAPSVSAWVFYPTVGVAKDESARLSGILYGERQITAEYVKPSQAHSIPVLLRGLPNSVKKEELHTFCTRSSSVSLNSPNYRESQNDNIRSYLTQFGPLKFLEVLPTKASDLEITGFVEFATRKAAADALQALKKAQHEFLGKGRISAQSVVYSKYDCSNCPFTLIRDELQHLSGPSSDATCTIQCYDKPPRVYVYGRRANAVAHVTKSVQDLIFGTEFATWDPYFDTSSSDEALRRISDDTSFHIERDKRRRALRIWGRRELAEKKIIRLLKTVQAKRHSLRLAQGSLPALIRGGLQKLHDEFGTSKILLDVHSRTVTVLGDIRTEVEARLQTLPVRNSSGTQTNDCCLCFADAIEPVELACSHIYCSGCLKLVLRPVAGLEFITPRACVADVEGGSCLAPIPIRTIFSHLSDIDQTTLFEGSLLSFVRSEPTFRFCPSGCPVVYRLGIASTVYTCPECNLDLCASCAVPMHAGLTCAEYETLRNSA